ncbi:hypothetical protein HF521_019394 [Silurus meridionalis]|uniref:Uncharacterized protein n=1 Tax=Silurus meridionalis TaxID=175797 RepID=A0A8T0BL84_SILME|nr:hypothetical protein HF521_019394 [Silurus meridionalis]
MHEAAVLGLELKYQNPEIMLVNYRPRLRRYAEKKKKKHNAGAFSPLSMAEDGKKTHNSRTKRQGLAKTKLVKQLLKQHKSHHEQTSPTKKNKVPKRKQEKKPYQPGTYSVLSYTAQDKERSGGQKEDLDD